MEQEPFTLVKNEEAKSPQTTFATTASLENFSFIRNSAAEEPKQNKFPISRERLALIGAIFGGLSMITWVVILLGVCASLAGGVFSILGLKSSRSNLAKIGLALSIIGLILSVGYIFAAYNGMINYNYFTSEFWG